MQIEKALEKRFSKDFSKYLQTALPKKLSVSAATWWRWKKGSRSPSTQQVRDMVNFINEHLPKNKGKHRANELT